MNIILSLMNALPAQFWWLSGGLFIVGGGFRFYFGVIEKNQQKGKKIIKRSVFGMLIGVVVVLIPNFPWLSLILIVVIIVLLLLAWWGGGGDSGGGDSGGGIGYGSAGDL